MNIFLKSLYTFKEKIKTHKKNIYFSIFLIFVFLLVLIIGQQTLVTIPKKGGEINEIILNSKPRFINPVLASSPVDLDLVALIYSPLFKIDGKNKKLLENIATYTLSEDKKTYTINLRDDVFFHDGIKLTADDVIFTIKKIQDPLIKSPYYGPWLGVEVEKINDFSLKLKLKNEYYQFINNLVLAPLPKHLWKDVAPEEFPFSKYNIKPIGSGPFQVAEVSRNNSGAIEKYTLNYFSNYFNSIPYLDKVIFHFFDNLTDYKKSIIYQKKKNVNKTFFSDSKTLLSKVIKTKNETNTTKESQNKTILLETPKVFGIFIKSTGSNEALLNKKFRDLLSNVIKQNDGVSRDDFAKLSGFKYSEKEILVFNEQEIILNLTFFKDDYFKKITTELKENLAKYGIQLSLNIINNQTDLENIIRDRNFEIILFGYNAGLIKDLFYFFHSSQISDPGANITGINSKDADKLLLDLRKNIEAETRKKKMEELESTIKNYSLFIPLYQGQSFYAIPQNLKNFKIKIINSRENRFNNIEKWYLKEEKVLPFFKNNI